MIKLIASDMDGTLLQNGAQEPSGEMLDMIRKMKELGIQFVAASGRQYPNLRRMFSPVWQDVIFIAENGSVIVYRDEVLDKTVLPTGQVRELICDLYRDDRCDVVASGVSSLYVQPKPRSRPYVDSLLYDTKNTLTVVDDIVALDQEVVKVSAMAYDNKALELFADLNRKWGGRFQVAVSGPEWVDFTLTNKGEALGKVQKRLCLQREEMMAFGDNYNDASMFEAVGYSYAMHGAGDEIQRMARHSCATVEDVVHKLLCYQQSGS